MKELTKGYRTSNGAFLSAYIQRGTVQSKQKKRNEKIILPSIIKQYVQKKKN